MITKWIEFTVAADSADRFGAELHTMQELSRPEAGCLHYSAWRSEDAPQVFFVLETWQSDEHLEAHRNSTHMAAFVETCTPMIVAKSGTALHPAG